MFEKRWRYVIQLSDGSHGARRPMCCHHSGAERRASRKRGNLLWRHSTAARRLRELIRSVCQLTLGSPHVEDSANPPRTHSQSRQGRKIIAHRFIGGDQREHKPRVPRGRHTSRSHRLPSIGIHWVRRPPESVSCRPSTGLIIGVPSTHPPLKRWAIIGRP